MRFGSRTVLNLTMKDIRTRKPLLVFESLKLSEIANKTNTVYSKGGQENTKYIGWTSDKDIKLSAEDALLTIESLKYLWGGKLDKKLKTLSSNPESIEVNVNGELVLSKTPKVDKLHPIYVFKTEEDGTTLKEEYLPEAEGVSEPTPKHYVLTDNKIKLGGFKGNTGEAGVYKVVVGTSDITIDNVKFTYSSSTGASGKWSNATELKALIEADSTLNEKYTVVVSSSNLTLTQKDGYFSSVAPVVSGTGNSVTVTKAGKEGVALEVYENDVFRVDYYFENTTNVLSITSKDFPSTYYWEGSTLFRDEDNLDHISRITIPAGKLIADFNISMKSEGKRVCRLM